MNRINSIEDLAKIAGAELGAAGKKTGSTKKYNVKKQSTDKLLTVVGQELDRSTSIKKLDTNLQWTVKRKHFKSKTVNRRLRHPIVCPYCRTQMIYGVSRKRRMWDVEHIFNKKMFIGNELSGEVNHITKSCKSCNHEKSQLEDTFSALILIPSVVEGNSPYADAMLKKSLKKLKGSIHRKSGKPLSEHLEFVDLWLPTSRHGYGKGIKLKDISFDDFDELYKMHIQAMHYRKYGLYLDRSRIDIAGKNFFYKEEGDNIFSVLPTLDVIIDDMYVYGQHSVIIQTVHIPEDSSKQMWILSYHQNLIVAAFVNCSDIFNID